MSKALDRKISKSVGQCFRKARYKTEHQANSMKERVYKERKVKLRPYYCLGCAGWHLTSQLEKAA